MRRSLAAFALLIASCSSDSDPATSRLQPGQMVRVPGDLESRDLRTATVEGPDGVAFPIGHPGHGGGFLITGDEARVVSDDQPDDGAYPKGRWTVVEVTKHQDAAKGRDFTGMRCRVPRDRIRPFP